MVGDPLLGGRPTRLACPGMAVGREDVIVGGVLVLAVVMETFGHDVCLVSEDDILDGLAASLMTLEGLPGSPTADPARQSGRSQRALVDMCHHGDARSASSTRPKQTDCAGSRRCARDEAEDDLMGCSGRRLSYCRAGASVDGILAVCIGDATSRSGPSASRCPGPRMVLRGWPGQGEGLVGQREVRVVCRVVLNPCSPARVKHPDLPVEPDHVLPVDPTGLLRPLEMDQLRVGVHPMRQPASFSREAEVGIPEYRR